MEERWNNATQSTRHDWLFAAGVHNVTFKFLDWHDLPTAVQATISKYFGY